MLVEAERGRCATGRAHAAFGPRPGRPGTAQALAALRGVVREVNELYCRGGRRGLVRCWPGRRCWSAASERSLHRGGAVDSLARPAGVAELAAGLGDAGLLELVDADGTLVAVTLAAGRCGCTDWPMRAADDLLDRVAFAVSRLLRPDLPAALHTAAATLLRDSAARADDALLRRMPELADRPLVVVPTGSLQNVPWALLPSCAGGRSRSPPRRRCGSPPARAPAAPGTRWSP